MRRTFSDIEADVCMLISGDDTDHPPAAPLMMKRL